MKNHYYLFLIVWIIGIPRVISGQNLPAYVPTDSLLGWWSLDSTGLDSSPHQNHGTVNGATAATSRHGIPFKAMSFNGLSDFIQGTVSGFNYTDATTVSAWVKFTGDAGGSDSDPYFSLGAPGQQTFSYSMIYSQEMLDLQSACFDNPQHVDNLTDVWHHLVVIDTNTETYIYLDGTLVYDFTTMQPDSCYQGDNTFYIGGGFDDRFVTGMIDDVGFWNRALEPMEIMDLYHACDSLIYDHYNLFTSIHWGYYGSMAVIVPYPNATFQWQFKDWLSGVFQNISDDNFYTGTNNDTLVVYSDLLTEGFFRCIVNEGACADTSLEFYFLTYINSLPDFSTNHIEVFPNPVQQGVTVRWKDDNPALIPLSFYITDLAGRQVMNGQMNSNPTIIDISTLSSGVYFLKADAEKFRPIKLIKQ